VACAKNPGKKSILGRFPAFLLENRQMADFMAKAEIFRNFCPILDF
jgi:hypothetical protein